MVDRGNVTQGSYKSLFLKLVIPHGEPAHIHFYPRGTPVAFLTQRHGGSRTIRSRSCTRSGNTRRCCLEWLLAVVCSFTANRQVKCESGAPRGTIVSARGTNSAMPDGAPIQLPCDFTSGQAPNTSSLVSLDYSADRPSARYVKPLTAGLGISLLLFVFVALFSCPCGVSRQQQEQARQARASTDTANILTAIDSFATDTGRYPTSAEGLEALVIAPTNTPGWTGYLKSRPLDPWGHPYVYRISATQVEVRSTGADGIPDTSDDIVATNSIP